MFLLQIWFIGRTLASQAGKAGSIPVICFLNFVESAGKPVVIGIPALFIISESEVFLPKNATRNATHLIDSISESEHPAIPVKN